MNMAIVRQASQSEHRTVFLLDETHLKPSPFTPAKLMAGRLVISILEGGMQLSWKLGLAAFAAAIVAARYMYGKTSTEVLGKTEPRWTFGPTDVKSVLRLHPTWNHKTLEHVANELEASQRWRRLNEEE